MSRLLEDILLMSYCKLHNIAVYIIDYKEIADKTDRYQLYLHNLYTNTV